jgi:hypothetical protein
MSTYQASRTQLVARPITTRVAHRDATRPGRQWAARARHARGAVAVRAMSVMVAAIFAVSIVGLYLAMSAPGVDYIHPPTAASVWAAVGLLNTCLAMAVGMGIAWRAEQVS